MVKKIGLDDPIYITDSQNSLKKMKFVVANYFATTQDEPAPQFSSEPISLELDEGSSTEIPFSIQNTGISDLHYVIDFKPVMEEVAAKRVSKVNLLQMILFFPFVIPF